MADYADLSQPNYVAQDYPQYLNDAVNWTNYVSEGKLNASNPQSVINYLLQALVWGKREIDLEVESLPTAGVLSFLDKVAGVKRSLGTKARATIEVTLRNTRNNVFLLDKGYPISTYDNKLTFRTIEDLIIPPGAVSGTVVVEAEETGTKYNVSVGSINRVFLEYADVQSIQNIEDAQGGSNEETEEEAVIRGARFIGRRNTLMSVDDIEDFVYENVGVGSSVKVIEWYSKDGSSKPGEIEVYVLDSQGKPLNSAQRIVLQSQIQSSTPLGFRLLTSVKPMEILNIDCFANIIVFDSANPEEVANNLFNIYKARLSPGFIKAGETLYLNKMIEALQSEASVNRLDNLKLNGQALDVLMPNEYTVAFPQSFSVKILSQSGIDYGLFLYGGDSV
jgi:hypothetical protein